MNNLIAEQIKEDSPHLAQVKNLGRTNSRTLGFFPEGAFDEHAAKGGLLIVRNKKGEVYGYLLFRVVHRGGVLPVAVIVHLCVDGAYRNKGIAKILVKKLRDITEDNFLRLELSCRRDYEANNFWPRIGFKYADETLGRGGQPIVKWVMEFRKLPLMDLMEKQRDTEKKFLAGLDANIFYRLQDPIPEGPSNARLLSEEAKALQGDWLADDVSLLITAETFNEIERNDDSAERRRRLNFARQFGRLTGKLENVEDLKQQLSSYFPINPNESLRSDITQLAHAISGNAHFFITQDTDLLSKDEAIHNEFGIRILPPGEFIIRLDEIIREVEYRPNRLGGSHALAISKVRSDQVPQLYPIFHWSSPKERRRQFEARFRNFIAQPNRYDAELCQMDSKPLALIVCDRGASCELGVPMIRVSRSPLAETVLRHLLRRVVLMSAKENRPFLRVTDISNQGGLLQALEEGGFTRIEDQWVKFSLQVADSSASLLMKLEELKNRFTEIEPFLDNLVAELSCAADQQDSIRLADLERRLFPVRILDANISSFIVPIKPIWAQHLFDEDIARGMLWGCRDDLLLRNENVYYRSAHPSKKILSPARVLWYVTRDSNNPLSSKQIRACSSLDEVIIGRAKDLFRRFERLGIYEWKDVLRTAGDDANNHIMALRFSNTEFFSCPIGLPEIRYILSDEEGKQPMLQSPQRILPCTFSRIYKAASRRIGGHP